jgi:hypothetical protein
MEWRGIAEQASTEMDSEKLAVLVDELCRELDQQHQSAIACLCPVSNLQVLPDSKHHRKFPLPLLA